MSLVDFALLLVVAILFLIVTVVVAQLTRSGTAVCAVQAGYLGTLVALGKLNARLAGKRLALHVSSELVTSAGRAAPEGRWRVLPRHRR